MRILRIFPAMLASTFILMTGCEKENYDAPESAVETTTITKLKSGPVNLSKMNLDQEFTPIISVNPEYQNILKAATAVEESECDYTAINYWISGELANWTATERYYANYYLMYDLPTYHALFFENSSEGQYYGSEGEYTIALERTFKDLKRFWDVPSSELVMAAMHGNMLQDRDKIIETYTFVYGIPLEFAEVYADDVLLLQELFPEYRNGDHPVFTFNAFAFNGGDFGIIVPEKIIMGDGILDAYTGLGFEDVAPQAILAHEYGHQIQYKKNVFEGESTPEKTRRTELMADAFAAYYLSHARGASMQWKRVQLFLEVFFNIGDCSFDSDGHHGTPLQRMATAEWAYQLADDARKQGKILSSEEFISIFDEKLPELINK